MNIFPEKSKNSNPRRHLFFHQNDPLLRPTAQSNGSKRHFELNCASLVKHAVHFVIFKFQNGPQRPILGSLASEINSGHLYCRGVLWAAFLLPLHIAVKSPVLQQRLVMRRGYA